MVLYFINKGLNWLVWTRLKIHAENPPQMLRRQIYLHIYWSAYLRTYIDSILKAMGICWLPVRASHVWGTKRVKTAKALRQDVECSSPLINTCCYYYGAKIILLGGIQVLVPPCTDPVPACPSSTGIGEILFWITPSRWFLANSLRRQRSCLSPEHKGRFACCPVS